ncbi:MAG: hypothetical protein R2712_22540 [Vicinamibacterales bacterium]
MHDLIPSRARISANVGAVTYDDRMGPLGFWAPFFFFSRRNMAVRGPMGRGKRERERARAERQKEKAARREEAKQRRASAPSSIGGEDPDIAGIVPGPQANPWGDEEPLDDAEDADDNPDDSA